MAENPAAQPAILCRHCLHPITLPANGVEISGRHFHTFFNPAGIVFQIACFSQAPGCRLHGQPTATFSWFAGYLWNLALCDNCLEQLGWFYQALDTAGFFGLIRDRLVSGAVDNPGS